MFLGIVVFFGRGGSWWLLVAPGGSWWLLAAWVRGSYGSTDFFGSYGSLVILGGSTDHFACYLHTFGPRAFILHAICTLLEPQPVRLHAICIFLGLKRSVEGLFTIYLGFI